MGLHVVAEFVTVLCVCVRAARNGRQAMKLDSVFLGNGILQWLLRTVQKCQLQNS